MQQTLARCRLLVPISAVLLVWISTPATAQTPPSSPPISAPGQLVDLGGWRIHLNCTGPLSASQPTVILEAGAGGFSVDWSLVQPEVARFARVCSYDRAGLRWSDLGPRQRTLRQIVWELHTLLEKTGVRPPYVLVGHSYGGILARRYASICRSDVVGIVLCESGNERGVAVLRDGKMVRLVETATGRPIPAVKTSGPLRESDIPPDILSQIETAARQMAPHATDPPYSKLPDDAQRMRAWAFSQVKHWATNDNPFEAEELAAMLAEQGKKEHLLGDMPVIVLSRGILENEGPEGGASEDEHKRNQAALVALSSVGKQIIARHSGHEVLISEPDLVVTAIREVWRQRGDEVYGATHSSCPECGLTPISPPHVKNADLLRPVVDPRRRATVEGDLRIIAFPSVPSSFPALALRVTKDPTPIEARAPRGEARGS